MEIARWMYYVVVSCALVSCIVAKTVSLNKLIEAESNQIETAVHTTTPPKIEDSEPAAVRFSLSKGLKPLNRLSKKYKESGTKLNLISLGKRISPLQYRKTFQIKSPLKPKRVKHSLRTRHKRKNQSIKREIDGHALLNQKYIPLLKSLGMLFDNILGTESSESIEQTKHKRKRLRYILEGDDISCQCPRKNEYNAVSNSEEEAVVSTTPIAAEVTVTTETPTTTTDYSSVGDFRGFRHHPNVPLLLPRNTTSTRRDHHGVGERSRTTHNGSAERYIPRDHGDSEYTSEWGQERSDAESYEDNTHNASRNDASSTGTRGTYVRVRDRQLGSNTKEIHEDDAAIKKGKTKKFLEVGKGSAQFDGTNKLKNKRDQAKSGKLLSKPIRRQRGFVSNANVVDSAEFLQPEDDNKEGVFNVTYDSSSDQRITNGNGSYSSEDQKVNAGAETMIDTVLATIKPIEYSAKSKEMIDEESTISETAPSGEYYGYKNDSNENIGHIITDDVMNSNTNQTLNFTQELKDTFESEEIPSKYGLEVISQYTEKPEIKSLSAETDDSGKNSEELTFSSKGLSSRVMTEEVPKTEQLKPPEVEIPISFSTVSRTRSKGPTVMIFDGYSITRHKNGENKLAEKTIRIRP